MARIGLLGGSFNPAHRGHRHISLAAMRALGLDEVWWLVSPGNPLKEGAKDMAPFEARLASAERMARGAPIRVSDFERREGTRYTVDTVRRLKRRHPAHRFIWLLGSDTLPNFHKWRDWRGLAREVPIAVIRRPGYDSAAHAARAMGWLQKVCPSFEPGEKLDGVECTGDHFPSPAARPDVRDRHSCARPQLVSPIASARSSGAGVTVVPSFARRPLDRTSR